VCRGPSVYSGGLLYIYNKGVHFNIAYKGVHFNISYKGGLYIYIRGRGYIYIRGSIISGGFIWGFATYRPIAPIAPQGPVGSYLPAQLGRICGVCIYKGEVSYI
jgi:hypothetical protein